MPLPLNLAVKYKNNYFLETGSLFGDGIQTALWAGYNNIISIEISTACYAKCQERFKDNPRVRLCLGDSELVLEPIIQEITEPITFWLDAHQQEDDTAIPLHESALMKELDIIRTHPIKTHVLLIDDIRCWEAEYGLNKEEVISIIKTINPNYKISYEQGLVPGDILVACP